LAGKPAKTDRAGTLRFRPGQCGAVNLLVLAHP